MGIFSFSKSSNGRKFSLALIIYTIYSLTNVLRGLPVMGVQMPIILFCYILLLSSCNSKALSRVVFTTFILILFDFFFIYLQDAERIDSLQNAIGFNYYIFMCLFPILFAVSGNLELIDRRKFLNFIYIIAGITAITTILGTFIYESPCRELATPDNVDLDRFYKSHNVGGFGYIYFLVLITPILIREVIQNKSIIKILLIALYGFCILRSEYTTALMLFFFGIVITFLISTRSTFIRIGVIVGIIVILVSLQDIFNYASTSLSETSYMMSKRFEMMTDYSQYGDADDDLGIRIMLYMQSLSAFFHSPLFGNLLSFSPVPLGGHSEILDYIGNSGLFGIVVFIFFVRYFRKKTPIGRINLKDPFLKAAFTLALILATINTFLSPELYIALLILPLLVDYNSRYALES